MNRLIKLTAIFAVAVSLGLISHDVRASGKAIYKPATNKVSNKLQPQPGPGQGVGNSSPTQPSQPSVPPVWKKFPPGTITRVIGNTGNKVPPVWTKFPPGSIGRIIGTGNQTPPTNPNPTQPPKRGGMSGYGFGGASFGGGTIVTTTDPVAAAPADAATPAATAASESDSDNLPQIAAGSNFTLKGEKFGDKPGHVGVVIGELLISVEVTSWSNTAITVNLPAIGVNSAAKASFVIERADGTIAKGTSFELIAAR